MIDDPRRAFRRPDYGLDQHDAADLSKELACSAKAADALVDYDADLKHLPTAVEARYRKAKLLFDGGHYREALEQFISASKLLDPPDPEIVYWVGRSYEKLEDFERADDAYTRALAANPPDDFRCVINYVRALVRMRMGMCSGAKEDLDLTIGEGVMASDEPEPDSPRSNESEQAAPQSAASISPETASGQFSTAAAPDSPEPSTDSRAPEPPGDSTPPATPPHGNRNGAENKRTMCRKLLANAYYFRALIAEQHGDFESALTDLGRAIDADAAHADAHFRRGFLRRKWQFERQVPDHDAILGDFNQAVKLAEDETQRLQTELDEHRRERRATAIAASLSIRRSFARKYLLWRGRQYLEMGQTGTTPVDASHLDNAIRDFTGVLNLSPSRESVRRGDLLGIEALTHRGEAHLLNAKSRTGEAASLSAQEAVKDFTNVLRVEGRHAFVYKWRADAHHLAGQIDDARADYDRAVTLEPDFSSAYLKKGLEVRRKDLDEAIRKLAEAVRLRPEYVEGWYHLGLLRRESGIDYDQAANDFRRVLELQPKHIYARFELGQTYGYLARQYERNPAEARRYRMMQIESFDKLLTQNPNLDYVLDARARAHLELEDHESAVRDLRHSRQVRPELLS